MDLLSRVRPLEGDIMGEGGWLPSSAGTVALRGRTGAGFTHLPGAALVQGDTLVPLVHVVWVLAQQDAVEEQGPPADELLEAGQAQLQVHIIWEPQACS